jgi:hypothetical protein
MKTSLGHSRHLLAKKACSHMNLCAHTRNEARPPDKIAFFGTRHMTSTTSLSRMSNDINGFGRVYKIKVSPCLKLDVVPLLPCFHTTFRSTVMKRGGVEKSNLISVQSEQENRKDDTNRSFNNKTITFFGTHNLSEHTIF